MDPIALILQAIDAGESPDTGMQAMIPDDIYDVYGRFNDLLVSRFADSLTAQTIIEQYVAQPDLYEGALIDMLKDEGLDHDEDVINAARDFMELMNERGALRGDYTVDFDDQDLEHFV